LRKRQSSGPASKTRAKIRKVELRIRHHCCGNADDQASGREDTIVGPEHCRSQPPDAVDEVALEAMVTNASAGLG
jgi:hypothetical protein